MKLPNGDGNVSKLSGKRRNPWRARKTIGWEYVHKTEKEWIDKRTGKIVANPTQQQILTKQVIERFKVVKQPTVEQLLNKEVRQVQKYINIGYYPTRSDAIAALYAYKENPFDIHLATMTFEECYDKWSDEHFPKISDSNIQGYKAAYKLCSGIEKMRLVDIKLDHLQRVVDDSGKNTPTLKKLKVLFGMVFDYAVKHEIVDSNKREIVRYVDISRAGNPNAYHRQPFTKAEVQKLWKWHHSSPYIDVILMLIYSGCRISELLNLKKENVNLQEKWFDIIKSKTEAGVRKVPIADKVLPFFQYWYNLNHSEYLISTPEGSHLIHRNYYDSYWKPFMEQLDMEHRPHDTRHTCISLLTSAGVDERVIKKIVGHKGQGVTETVYTHFEIDKLLDAINKI